ncbi:MAG TPA: hypothetical protein VMS32_05815 [Verrucomicrobiae bacterium]|jgi:hypothetical protein|nr:hypothetical protein [Verrucomicrobiae bacterium]
MTDDQISNNPTPQAPPEATTAGEVAKAQTPIATEQVDATNPLLLKFLSSEIIVIGLATLAAYAIVFSYEAGFCYYYGIPYNLISLNLTTGLSVAVILLTGFYSVLFLQFPFGKVWLIKSDAEFRYWADSFTWWIVVSIPAMFSGIHCVAIATLVATVHIGSAKMRQFLMKFEGPRKALSQPTGPIFQELVGRKLPPKLHFIISLVVVFLIVSFGYGRYRASTDPQYTSTVGGKNYIMLQFYGDYVVAAPYAILKNQTVRFAFFSKTIDVLAIQPGLRVFKLGEREAPEDLAVRPPISIQTPRQANHTGFYGWLYSYSSF